MKWTLRIALILTVFALPLALTFWGLPYWQNQRGRHAADAAWAANAAVFYRTENPAGARFDAKSGLGKIPYRSEGPSFLEQYFLEGYNERLQQRLDAGELPANSRKKWAKDITHPVRYFNAIPASNRLELRLDDNALTVPDLSPAPILRLRTILDPQSLRVPVLSLTTPDQKEHQLPLSHPSVVSKMELVWGPAGSRTVFLRYSSDRAPAQQRPVLYSVVDLECGFWLNRELTRE